MPEISHFIFAKFILAFFSRKFSFNRNQLSMQFYLERTGSTVACVWNIFQPPVLSRELGPSNNWFNGSLDPHRLESTVSCTFSRNRFLSISSRRVGLVSSVTPRQVEVSKLWTWTIPFASISGSPSLPFLKKNKIKSYFLFYINWTISLDKGTWNITMLCVKSLK